jgi:hypothetical protein
MKDGRREAEGVGSDRVFAYRLPLTACRGPNETHR